MSPDSNKFATPSSIRPTSADASTYRAFEYAKDINKGSRYVTVLVTRTVLGKMQHVKRENHSLMKPSKGYDSVSSPVRSNLMPGTHLFTGLRTREWGRSVGVCCL